MMIVFSSRPSRDNSFALFGTPAKEPQKLTAYIMGDGHNPAEQVFREGGARRA